MTQTDRANVTSRAGAALWLLVTILVACWGSATGAQARAHAPASDGAATLGPPADLSAPADQTAANLTADGRFAKPSVRPRGLPRAIILASDRPQAGRAQRSGDGKPDGIVPAQAPLPILAGAALRPIPDRSVVRPTALRAFDPRGPPSRLG